MNKRYDAKLKRNVYEIWTGQYYASNDSEAIITTLLGSCIAVCLIDPINGVIGMNHFMLPGDFRREDIIVSQDGRYGIYAMELLINAMMKKGANRGHLKSKIFGGGYVLNQSFSNIADANIEFARIFLKMENIPIITEDIAGPYGRKIYFVGKTKDVFVKKIKGSNLNQRLEADKAYLDSLKEKNKAEEDNLTLF
ncbi:MAG: hypothetical protein ACOCRV_00830 [bacterium]